MGSNPFGAHRIGIHRAMAWPVNERPADDVVGAPAPLCGVRIEL
jgi:hypothetical protein